MNIDTNELTPGDRIRVTIKQGKTVMNGEVITGTFKRIGLQGITVTKVDGLGEPRDVTRKLDRIASIERA